MADSNQFKVVLGADSTPLSAALVAATKDIHDFSITAGKIKNVAFSTQGIDNYRKSVGQLKTDISKVQFQNFAKQITGVNVAAGQTGRVLSSVRPGANAAGQSLTDLNRIVQDVPFGFVGIQNNIQPMLDSFQRLKAETGSTSRALKTMAGSLIGPGGIGLAIAAASTAILLFQNGIAGFNKKSKESKEATDAYGDSLKSIVSTLAEEATRVSVLVDALKDDSLTRKEKSQAIKELQKINPVYFGQLREEAGLVVGLQNAYTGYINALKAQFAAKAVDKQIAELFDKKLELEIKLDPIISKLTVLSPETLNQIAEIEAKLKALPQIDFTKLRIDQPLTTAQKEVLRLQGLLRNLKAPAINMDNRFVEDRKQLEGINKQIDSLIGKRRSFGKTDLDLGSGGTETKKEDAVLKSLNSELDGLRDRLEVTNKLREAGLLPIFRENEALELQLSILDKLSQIDAREVEIKAKPKLEIDPALNQLEIDKVYNDYASRIQSPFATPLLITPKITISPAASIQPGMFQPMVDNITRQAEAASAEINTNLQTIFAEGELQNLVAGSFSQVGEDIGAAIGKGENPIQAAAESFLHVIGAVVDAFGKKIVAIGVAMLVTQEAIKKSFSNPAVAIAAGVALTILGSALKNIKFNVPQMATGGVLTGPKSGYLAMLHGTEVVAPIDKVGALMGARAMETAVTHTIRGSELHLLYRTYEKERARGL